MDRYYFDHGHVPSLNVLSRPGFIVPGTVLMRCVSVVSPVKRFARSAITIYGKKKKKNRTDDCRAKTVRSDLSLNVHV